MSSQRKNDLYNNYDEKLKSLNPKYNKQISILNKDRVWEIMDKSLQRDIKSIQESIVKHIEYTLAISRFDIKKEYIFQGTALSVRDRLLEQWNDTQLYMKLHNPKKYFI